MASPFTSENRNSIYGRGKTSHMQYGWGIGEWMDGWADFIPSKNANISGIKLF